MSEFIGSRISLISKSDIRYVGTLHDINSENSTVALENVSSFGTEGRRGKPDDEVPPSDQVYEYIVFRGSDVKDLRIEEPPKDTKPPQPPQIPDDPAILGSSRPAQPAPQQGHEPPQGPRQQQPQFQPPPPFQYQQYGQYPQRFGGPQGGPGPFQGPPGGFQGYPGMPYGGPPGWIPPPGQVFHQPPGPFSPHHQGPPFGAPVSQQGPQGPKQGPQQIQQQQAQQPQPAAPVKPSTPASAAPSIPPAPSADAQKATAKVSSPEREVQPIVMTEQPPSETRTAQAAPSPPMESKPDVAAALAPPSKPAPTGPKGGRIVPAVPLQARSGAKPAAKANVPVQTTTNTLPHHVAKPPGDAAANAALQYQNATQAATAAVAAAMAKLPPFGGQTQKQPAEGDAMDNLTKKVNEMRVDDRIRHSRQPGTGGYAAGHRGGRGGRRGGREPERGLAVPTTDFDFETANAQFNKQDIVKEAIASGSPVSSPVDGQGAFGLNGDSGIDGSSEVVIPAATNSTYNKSSFFDNISSEAKDREESSDSRNREFRTEERRRNMETFGMSSVDGGYRGGFRGRGRGRGGFRSGYGRGGPRGGFRGARGGGEAAATAAQ